MSAYEIFGRAKAAGVRLYVVGGKLCYEGEGGAVDALLPIFKAHKAELLALLSKAPQKESVTPAPGKRGHHEIPLPTAAQQRATLECFAENALAPDVRETAKEALQLLNSAPRTPEIPREGELTPDLKRVVELTQEVFSQPPKPQPNDGLSPDAREALGIIRRLAGTARILDALAVADSMGVSVTALGGALVELERKRLIHPGDWTRCGTKVKLVTH